MPEPGREGGMSTLDSSGKKRAKTGGRVAGVPNKVNRDFRETVRRLLEDNAENVSVWLEQVANGDKPDPGRALDLLAKLAEYAAPKLGRVEHVGDGGGPVTVQAIERRIVDPG